jgi:hypothetical protein
MRAAREASRVSRAFVSVARGRPPGASSGFRNTHGHGNTSRLGVFDTKRSVHYTRCVPSVDDDVFRSSLLRPGTPSDKNNSTRRSPHNDALRSFHSGSPTSFKAKLPTGRSKRTQTEKEKEAGQGSGSDESTSSPNPNSSDESTSPEKEEKERDSYEFSDDRGVLGLHKKNSLDEANDARALNAVNVAVKANTLIFVTKLGAFGLTGSSVMLAEAVHSAADILNQVRVGAFPNRAAHCFTSNAGDCGGPITVTVVHTSSNTHTDYPDCCPHIVQYTSNTRPTNVLTLFLYTRRVCYCWA